VANIYCQVNNTLLQSVPDNYKNWPVTITVSPGAAAPGSVVTVKVSINASPNNGPAVVLNAGAYRMEATIKFNGSTTQLIGPKNASAVPIDSPIYAAGELPTVASGTITLPAAEGDYPIVLQDVWYNNVAGAGTNALTDIFDQRCNISTAPQKNAQAFTAPTIAVSADAAAPVVTADPTTDVTDTTEAADPPGSDLPQTGGNQTTSLLIALVLFQIGLILAVRSVRATPKTVPRHL